MNKYNFIKYYGIFMWKHYDDISTDKTELLDRSSLSLNELCQKLTCTMHTNFNSLKMRIISEPEKLSYSENLL